MKSAAVLLLVIATSAVVHCKNVPAFVWGKPSVTYVPALSRYSTDEFGALIASQTDEQTFTVVFVSDHLSTEDLAACRLKTRTCFQNLAKVERKTYLPTVEEPLAAFVGSGELKTVQYYPEDGKISSDIVPKAGSVVIVNLSGDDFASHDAAIDRLYNQLRTQYGNVLAVYTGRTPSFRSSSQPHIRRTRQADETRKSFIIAGRFLIAYEHIKAGKKSNENEFKLDEYEFSNVAMISDSDSTLEIELGGAGSKLEMNFTLSQGSWEISGIKFQGEGYYMRPRVHINMYFSYHCNNLEFYTPNWGSKIVLQEVQMQPFWPSVAYSELDKFGDSWDCVGFMSSGILTGLFLVFIFLLIGSYGVTWMLDIRTMDRFDDPKGKTITVNVSE